MAGYGGQGHAFKGAGRVDAFPIPASATKGPGKIRETVKMDRPPPAFRGESNLEDISSAGAPRFEVEERCSRSLDKIPPSFHDGRHGTAFVRLLGLSRPPASTRVQEPCARKIRRIKNVGGPRLRRSARDGHRPII